MVCFHGRAAEGEAEPHSRSIRAPLFEGLKDLGHISAWEPAAVILDFNQNAVCACADAQGDFSVRARKLEGVLQEIHNDCGEHLAVGFHRSLRRPAKP